MSVSTRPRLAAIPPSGGLRALNQPRPLVVEATRNGLPRAVAWRGELRPVRTIHDAWRIDDEWWRERPISRRYYRVELNDGRRLTLYHDLVDGAWYSQHYAPPAVPSLRAG